MVAGPHTAIAILCGRSEADCNIDEGDKIRAVYDGSWGEGPMPASKTRAKEGPLLPQCWIASCVASPAPLQDGSAVDWGFAFVDDFCWDLRQLRARRHTAVLLALLFIGAPQFGKKTKLALIKFWPRFHVGPKGPIGTMGPDKHSAATSVLHELSRRECFSSKGIELCVGWVTIICPMTTSFLQPRA